MTETTGLSAPQRRPVIVAIWLAFLLACAAVLISSLAFSYDLGLFLPPPTSQDQQVLVERLGEAPGSRFLLLGLPGADTEEMERARDALVETGEFTRVLAGPPTPELADIPDIVWRYRYLLADARLDAAGLQAALAERSSDLAFFAGTDFNTLLRADPTMAAIRTLESLAAGSSADAGRWVTADGTAVAIVETAAPAFDLEGQARAVATIRAALGTPATGATPLLSGPGVFGVELRDTIHAEARNRSIMASIGLVAVLLVAYRRPAVVLLAGLPLGTGALAGLAAVALFFPAVHGITLAFGFTLLGVAIDYPLHLFSHARHAPMKAAMHRLWPTLRLGAASTLIAYLTLALSGSEGLAQLGVFTASGLLAAALVTRWLLPELPWRVAASDRSGATGVPVRLSWWPALVLAAAGAASIASAAHDGFWNNNLSALSPVPAERLLRDQVFRDAVGTPSLRYVLALRAAEAESVLRATEALDGALDEARTAGWLGGWQTVTRVLPSEQSLERRAQRLPQAETLAEDLATALRATPFAPGIFGPFLADVAASAALAPLTPADFAGSSLEPFVASHLYRSGDEWVSLVSLFGTIDAAHLGAWLAERSDAAVLVDFRSASESLVAAYRTSTLRMLAAAFVAILVLLLWRLPPARALWSLGLVASVILATAGVLFTLGGPLNLYHVMALLLVAGLGLDYALFLGRASDGSAERADTRHAVLACAASTTVAFGVLGTSAIPALQALGSAVAVGTVLSAGAAWFGVRRSRETQAQVS